MSEVDDRASEGSDLLRFDVRSDDLDGALVELLAHPDQGRFGEAPVSVLRGLLVEGPEDGLGREGDLALDKIVGRHGVAEDETKYKWRPAGALLWEARSTLEVAVTGRWRADDGQGSRRHLRQSISTIRPKTRIDIEWLGRRGYADRRVGTRRTAAAEEMVAHESDLVALASACALRLKSA